MLQMAPAHPGALLHLANHRFYHGDYEQVPASRLGLVGAPPSMEWARPKPCMAPLLCDESCGTHTIRVQVQQLAQRAIACSGAAALQAEGHFQLGRALQAPMPPPHPFQTWSDVVRRGQTWSDVVDDAHA